jgi:threonine synthase
VRSRRLGQSFGLRSLYFKLDQCNPTGSYKDRFACCAISHMIAAGQRRCVATTSGNTGSSLAAYCAVAGIQCFIAVVEMAPIGKLQQMLAYGATIFRVRGFGIDPKISLQVFQLLDELGRKPDAAVQISAFKFSPRGMSGVRTISFELAEQLDGRIDHIFTQAGGGGLTWATAAGCEWLVEQGRIARCPKVECVQPLGNNTIAGPLREGQDRGQDVVCSSKISGLQVANVIDGHDALHACRRTGGTGHLVSDEFVWETQRRLARDEGIFCEPAGATAVAGALQAAKEGWVTPDAITVATITGSGFKDPPSVERMIADRACPLVGFAELRGCIAGS